MKRSISSVIAIIVVYSMVNPVAAQPSVEEVAVKNVINTLFESMLKGDSAMLRSVFYKDVTLASIFRDKSGNVVMRPESSVDAFAKAVGTPHKEAWHEEIWDVKVQLDGDFAQLWCDYAFYADKNFSHCGADSFELIKTKDGWKIFHLADTRRKEGCNVPKKISDKYK